MDTPHPTDPPPPEPPLVLPAADLPPLDPSTRDVVPVLEPAGESPVGPPVVLRPAGPPTRRLVAALAAGGAVVVVLGLSFWLFPFDTLCFLLSGAIVPPMVVLPLLAYAGERTPAVRPGAIAYWLVLTALGGISAYRTTASATEEQARWAWALAGICAGILAGVACFAPRVRAAAARGLPLDPRSFVHATALASVVSLIVIAFVPLLVLGRPPALDDAATEQMAGQMQQLPPGLILRLTCYVYFWMIAGFLCFVGFPIARSFGAALRRLGLVAPTWWQVVGAVAGAFALAVVMTGVDFGIGRLWQALGWPQTDAKKFEQLMGYAISPAGAVVVGVSAGLSEELFFRGALQPRLGLLLSNLAFAAMHAFQYSWDALLSVFLIGLVLGVVRKRTNTTTSAIVHGTYDFLLVLASYYQVDKWFGQ
ncbi:MAG TPA: type II CAAX endopeptidase family protein [Gemmataceae bacterium]|jgi:membrane protease YdiL (CAAX protease family)